MGAPIVLSIPDVMLFFNGVFIGAVLTVFLSKK